MKDAPWSVSRAPVVAAVPSHEVRRAEELFGPSVLVLDMGNADGTQGRKLLGRRVYLLLASRDYALGNHPPDTLEGLLFSRLSPEYRHIQGDLESLVAIHGAIRQVAPWVIEGRPGRSALKR